MSNRSYTSEELSAVLASMGVTDPTDVSRYGSGHINDTFKVETKRGVRYILQRVNTDIFPAEMLKSNIVRVTEFLKARQQHEFRMEENAQKAMLDQGGDAVKSAAEADKAQMDLEQKAVQLEAQKVKSATEIMKAMGV